jgi:HEAT repeat protein
VGDPVTEPHRRGRAQRDGVERQRRAIVAGFRGDHSTVADLDRDPDPAVRAARLSSLARLGELSTRDVLRALEDPDPSVRRRAAELAARVVGRGSRSALCAGLLGATGDPDPLVAEAAAWALGERRVRSAVARLAEMATSHPDSRCRESALGALGAIGDPAGLQAVLDALDDRPSVRRRAVVALVAFNGPVVEAALHRCLEDHDWQVREAAAVLLEVPEPAQSSRSVKTERSSSSASRH